MRAQQQQEQKKERSTSAAHSAGSVVPCRDAWVFAWLDAKSKRTPRHAIGIYFFVWLLVHACQAGTCVTVAVCAAVLAGARASILSASLKEVSTSIVPIRRAWLGMGDGRGLSHHAQHAHTFRTTRTHHCDRAARGSRAPDAVWVRARALPCGLR